MNFKKPTQKSGSPFKKEADIINFNNYNDFFNFSVD